MLNLKIGQALQTNTGLAYIMDIQKAKSITSLITGAGMVSILFDITLLRVDGYSTVIDEHTALGQAQTESIYPALTEEKKLKLLETEKKFNLKQNLILANYKEDAKKQRDQESLNQLLCLNSMPKGTKSLLVATYSENDSDSQTDYYGAKNIKSVIIGFSKHTRDLFPEMRKAAATFKHTLHLFDADDKSEHREKYSMGGGFYLKTGSRYSTGWGVKKLDLKYGSSNRLKTEDETVSTIKNVKKLTSFSTLDYSINSIYHTKKECNMFICSPVSRLERAKFLTEKHRAIKAGGYYSRRFGKSPAGFAFFTLLAAKIYCDNKENVTLKAESFSIKEKASLCTKFFKLAEGMQTKIDALLAPRESNTPRKMQFAKSALLDAEQHILVQKALFILAEGIKNKNMPDELKTITNKKQLFEILKLESLSDNQGYYECYYSTGKLKNPSDIGAFLMLLISAKTPENTFDNKSREVDILLSAVKFNKIAGYFSTEGKALDILIDSLELKPHHYVLEPEAGSGSIVDKIKPLVKKIDCVEINYSLCEILEKRGFSPNQGDFLAMKAKPIYDRIALNPPFEKDQHINHLMHSIKMLKPNTGLVCCIMPKGAHLKKHSLKNKRFSNLVKKWLDCGIAEIIELPENSFKKVGTSISTQILKVDFWGATL